MFERCTKIIKEHAAKAKLNNIKKPIKVSTSVSNTYKFGLIPIDGSISNI